MIIRQPLSNQVKGNKPSDDIVEVVNDNDVLTLIQDSNVNDQSIIIIKDITEQSVEVNTITDPTITVKDADFIQALDNYINLEDSISIIKDYPKVQVVKDFITHEQTLLLKDAGPVFRGDPGPEGPSGPDLYEVWKRQGNQGTFDDFINYLRGGLSSDGQYTYIHNQYIPDKKWTIQHNLNRYPVPTFEDSSGEVFDADFKYMNSNVIEVYIISPNAGKAYLN